MPALQRKLAYIDSRNGETAFQTSAGFAYTSSRHVRRRGGGIDGERGLDELPMRKASCESRKSKDQEARVTSRER